MCRSPILLALLPGWLVIAAEQPAVIAHPDASASYEAAYALLDKGSLRKALPHLEAAHEGGLRHAGVLIPLARARFAAGEEDRAVELITDIVRNASSPHLLLEMGKLLFERALYRQAIAPLRKSWERRSAAYDGGMYLALSHFMLEQYAISAEILMAMRTDPEVRPTAEYFVLLGSVYARLGRWEQAEGELKTAIEMAPERADGYLNAGLMALERGDSTRARSLLDKGIEGIRAGTKILYTLRSRTNCNHLRLPANTPRPDVERGRFYTGFARALQNMQHWQSALEVYLLALRLDAGSAEAYGGVGPLCQELGSPEVGKVFLQQGLERHARSAELHYYFGSVCAFMGEWEKALQGFEQAIQLTEPAVPPRYLLRLGTAQAVLLNEADAERSFQRALANDDGFAAAHYELGKLYLTQKKLVLAERSLERALEIDPMLREAYLLLRVGFFAYRQRGKRTGHIEDLSAAESAPLRISGVVSKPGRPHTFWRGLIVSMLVATATHSNDAKQFRPTLLFTDVTREAGLSAFRNIQGSPAKQHIVEVMGGGAGFLDYDRDGNLDILLVRGSTIEQFPRGGDRVCALYRGIGRGQFTEVTTEAGLTARGWGMGVAVGDIDNDGWDDIYIAGYRKNLLFRNRRDGTFEESAGARESPVAAGAWRQLSPISTAMATWISMSPTT